MSHDEQGKPAHTTGWIPAGRVPLLVAVLVALLAWGTMAARADHGMVLQVDDFDDSAAGVMPRSASDPRLRMGYVAGEYQIAIIDPAYDRLATVNNPTPRGDVALAISVRFVGAAQERYVVLACRTGDAGHYRMSVDPGNGSFTLARWGAAGERRLAGGPSPVIRRDQESNRIELSCTGSTIEAIINGVTVAAVTDTGLAAGGLFFGAGAYAGQALTLDARFDRFVLTQPGGGAPLPTPGRTVTPVPTAAPAPPGSHRISGALTIEGQPAPTGTTVRALVGERECGSARTTMAGRYSVAVLPESAAAGCGRAGAEVRLMVAPAFGSGWRQPAGFPFQPGGVLVRDIAIDLRQLTGDAENVPWTEAWWGDPRGMRIGICGEISDDAAAAVIAGHQQWVDAYYDLGFAIEIIADDEGACESDLPGILIFEEDLGDEDAIAGTVNFISPTEACRRNVPCWSAKAAIFINPGTFSQVEPQEQANIIAHEIGHALGLAHARACNGGTIMWANTACRFPMTHIGVDDVASLNAKFAVVGFAVPSPVNTAAARSDGWAAGSAATVSAGHPPLASGGGSYAEVARMLLPSIREWLRAQ